MKLLLLFILMNFVGDQIYIENSWIRNSSKGRNTALFLDLVNSGDKADTLYKVTSDLAEIVQIHETYEKGDMMGMREIKNVVIEPGSRFEFKPGSHHIMMIKLRKDLKEGDRGEIIFFFRNGGEIKINAPVKKMVKK